MRAATSAGFLYWVAMRRESMNWIGPPFAENASPLMYQEGPYVRSLQLVDAG